MINTQRLKIFPLTYNQLLKYVQCDGSLEKELNLDYQPRTITPDLKDALERVILPNVADKTKNYIYSTLWTIILKEENKMVGDLCFFGEPDSNGEIEIGYGTYDDFQNKGYMTEAVEGMIKWAALQTELRSVIAGTEEDNTPSFKVLEKNNFVKYTKLETKYMWRVVLIKNGIFIK